MTTNACAYRELDGAMDDRVVCLYCARCGTQVGTTDVYDDNWRTTCYDCGMSLNPRVTVSTPKTNYALDHIGEDSAREIIVAYWNRAMRYGFRLGDRIAIDLRAAEFKSYADDLDVDWELKCPMFRLPIDTMDNEGLDDTEFNHFEYEDGDGGSPKQFANGFCASRAAHDYVHKNLQQWAQEKMCQQANVDWQQYQAYRCIELEHKFYTYANGDCEKTDGNFLAHVLRYYDIPYDKDWLRLAYATVNESIEDVHDNYEYWKDRSAKWMADNNIKGFESKDEAVEFIEEKEQREERYLDGIDEMLENDDWEPEAGYEMGLTHPLLR